MKNINNNSVQEKNTSEFIKWLFELFFKRHGIMKARNIVADILCVNGLTVQKWIEGKSKPILLEKLRIGHLRGVFKKLSEKLHDEEMVPWMNRRNTFLEGNKPIDFLRAKTWEETEMVREAVNKL